MSDVGVLLTLCRTSLLAKSRGGDTRENGVYTVPRGGGQTTAGREGVRGVTGASYIRIMKEEWRLDV